MPDLTISQRDYRILLEMVNLATYVAQFHQRGDRDEWLEAFDNLSDKILRKAGNMGCGDLVERDNESGHWVPREDYESESFFRECTDEMVEQAFWEDLVARLSDRDISRATPKNQWDSMPEPEQSRRRQERDDFYWHEFETNGVDFLEVINRAPHG
jgi:hypothetical protein